MNVRDATLDDVDFLWDMLYVAATWDPEKTSLPPQEVLADPEIRVYLEDWGRKGDTALIAVDGTTRVGAAWYRFFSADNPAYGFIADSIPEVGIGVLEECRGRGVGTTLLGAIIERAKAAGVQALSLSVGERNRALHLYERHGFERIRKDGSASTMRLDL